MRVGLAVAASACLASVNLQASEPASGALLFASETLGLAGSHATPDHAPYPLLRQDDSGLHFDLGGSDKRKLQLMLQQPLSLSGNLAARHLDPGADLLGLDATLSLPLSEQFSLSTGVQREMSRARFQSLGSIQCMNGTLRADSYTASGCRFVNEPLGTTDRRRFNLGAQYDFSHASASVNWFATQSEAEQPVTNAVNGPVGQPVLGGGLMSPNLANPLFTPLAGDPLGYLNSEASGVDLNFQVGIATDTRGDLRLGLAFSSVLEAEYHGNHFSGPEALSWTLAEPFNSARMNLEWSKGAFSTGVQGYYRDSVNFLDRGSLDSLTTFDVHFTWRTPWNANLSVGATNVLNAGAEGNVGTDSAPVDPLESIYGRIPYVRYKQDL